mmetsp:Transcript_8906/g.11112  ORF Transcript_8906/g.11112 Transcript_8906/m.11112 type:complete len:303 (+) Transcript_8906:85-993(+)
MDIYTYKSIIKQRKLNPDNIRSNGIKEDVYQFQKDLLNGKTVWNNNFCLDWLCYMKLYHPLVSIFYAPKVHPYSREKRLSVLAVVLCSSVCWSSIAVEEGNRDHSKIVRYIILTIAAVFNTILDLFLRKIAMCECFIDSNVCLNQCCRYIGEQLIYIFLLIGFGVFVIGIAFAIDNGNFFQFFGYYILVSLLCWILEIIPLFIYFIKYWLNEKNTIQLNDNPYYISYLDYNEWIYGRKLTRTIFFDDDIQTQINDKSKYDTIELSNDISNNNAYDSDGIIPDNENETMLTSFHVSNNMFPYS